jgi:serine/threonine protein kinase
MVMGLVRGETLDERLKRDKQLPPEVVERLVVRLLDGLEEVHKAGFLHRDIKPANIILDSRNDPTLIDFGASRAAMADRTAALTAIFTPRYAAVEQLTSDKQGPWTDIYGLSATLYHAITGRPPPSSLERALDDTYEPLSRLLPARFSPALLQGIDIGLAVRAKDRPPSIAAWRDVLSSTKAPEGDTVLAARQQPAVVLTTQTPPAPPLAPTEPSRPVAAFEAAGTVAASKRGVAGAGRNRIVQNAGTMAAVVVLAAGGYWALATKPAPAPLQNLKVDDRAQAAAVQADRQREEEAARQKIGTAGRDKRPLELDPSASKIELVDNRFVLRGEIFNNSGVPASTTSLKLVFRKGGEVLGERTYPMVEGPVAPGGRLRFSRTLDSPPAGTTELVPTVE